MLEFCAHGVDVGMTWFGGMLVYVPRRVQVGTHGIGSECVVCERWVRTGNVGTCSVSWGSAFSVFCGRLVVYRMARRWLFFFLEGWGGVIFDGRLNADM
jgi:hypothetical protein